MNKRIGLWLATAGFGLLALVIGFFAYHSTTFTVNITNEEAQQRISTALEKRSLEEKKFNIESAIVMFVDGKVLIGAKVSAQFAGQSASADVIAEGTPEYRGGSFYFHPVSLPRFSNMHVGRADKPDGAFADTRKILKKKLEVFAEKHDLGGVAETIKADFHKWLVAKGEKIITREFSRYPLYTLKNDMKGIQIRAVLEKVEVVGDKLQATLSLAQLGYTIFISLVILVLVAGCTVFLVMNPEFGVAVAIISSIGS